MTVREELTPQQQIAQRTCEFMTEADLKGKEVGDYTACWNLLNAVIAGEAEIIDSKVLAGLKESDHEVKLMQQVMKRYPSVKSKVEKVAEELYWYD